MGAWGVGTFENDDALDWVGDLQSDGVTAIRTALELEGSDEYVEIDAGAMAVAAAEVVAAARDGDAMTLPDEVREWLDTNAGTITADDARAARKALERILDADSELSELWAESADAAAWRDEVDALLARLTAG